jgi:hypothetical protein
MQDVDIPVDKIKRPAKAMQMKIPRWLSKKVGIYAMDNLSEAQAWSAIDVNMDLPFFPFSKCVYRPNNEILVVGGLND